MHSFSHGFAAVFTQRVFSSLLDIRSIREWANNCLGEAEAKYSTASQNVKKNRLCAFLSVLDRAKNQEEFNDFLNKEENEELLSVFSYGPIYRPFGKIGYDLKSSRFGLPNSLLWKRKSAHAMWRMLYTACLESTVMTIESFLCDFAQSPLFGTQERKQIDGIPLHVLFGLLKKNLFFRSPNAFLEKYAEFNARRNCFVHNSGLVNKRNEKSLGGYHEGDRLPLSLNYLNNFLLDCSKMMLDCLCFVLQEMDDRDAFGWAIAEAIDIYYEIGPGEALIAFERLARLKMTAKKSSFLAAAMNLLCRKAVGLPLDQREIDRLSKEYRELPECDIYLAITMGDFEKAGEVMEKRTEPFVFEHPLRNPFFDEIHQHF